MALHLPRSNLPPNPRRAIPFSTHFHRDHISDNLMPGPPPQTWVVLYLASSWAAIPASESQPCPRGKLTPRIYITTVFSLPQHPNHFHLPFGLLDQKRKQRRRMLPPADTPVSRHIQGCTPSSHTPEHARHTQEERQQGLGSTAEDKPHSSCLQATIIYMTLCNQPRDYTFTGDFDAK